MADCLDDSDARRAPVRAVLRPKNAFMLGALPSSSSSANERTESPLISNLDPFQATGVIPPSSCRLSLAPNWVLSTGVTQCSPQSAAPKLLIESASTVKIMNSRCKEEGEARRPPRHPSSRVGGKQESWPPKKMRVARPYLKGKIHFSLTALLAQSCLHHQPLSALADTEQQVVLGAGVLIVE